ncbi:TPA: tRNA-uridine aminocarboxypropyltransferase, partial [Klebsiella pneumoniae]
VCLLMYDVEALKPSNTGWLIADVLDDCHAFLWQRTTVDPALLSLLADPRYAPCVVFPAEYAEPQRLISQAPDCSDGRRPLFILLDATWNEARKMFRRSPYLAHLPVLALQPETLSRYRLRRSRQAGHLCTAEVAALCLELAGEPAAAAALDGWFGLFSERYLDAKQRRPLDLHSPAMQQLLETQERFGQSWASSMPASISAQPK